MDLVAFTASAQRPPAANERLGRALPFYTRFHTDGTLGVNVLAQGIRTIPDSGIPCFGFSFPYPSMIGALIIHLQTCHACVI